MSVIVFDPEDVTGVLVEDGAGDLLILDGDPQPIQDAQTALGDVLLIDPEPPAVQVVQVEASVLLLLSRRYWSPFMIPVTVA